MKLLNEIPDYLVPDSIRDSVRPGIPQATEWERVGNQINAALVFTRSDFVNVHLSLVKQYTSRSFVSKICELCRKIEC